MKNVTAIIQARMGSKRLSSKVLADICGVPMLKHIADRVKKAGVSKVVVATTVDDTDTAIEDFCRQEGLLCFRGDAANVLKRYYDAAETIGGEVIVRLTGDNPLVEPVLIEACIKKISEQDYDYVSVSGCPLGCGAEAFSFSALEKAYFAASEKYQQEHVTPYIYDNPKLFNITEVAASEMYYAPDMRLTVDEKEDMELISILYRQFYAEGSIVSLPEVIKYLKQHAEISDINKNIKQKHYKEYEDNE